jgi:hypothetical protein
MLGVNSIVDRAILLSDPPTVDHLIDKSLPIAEVDSQIHLAKLHLSLPKALPAELADVCAKIIDKIREEFQAVSEQKNHPKCHVPTSVTAVHAVYIRAKNLF